ncbi:class I SAM-dependent methyltransferase [Paenibacillus macerans]|uniref:class I SAM-dependent methyltransferase n=1 Tax=Paenibacillus macerans TaxID=44252 RepID=UPI003D323567
MNYHEIIAAVGEGSAHPGGFAATAEFVEHIGIQPGLRILEVGCGTGRTACLLAQKGARVTAMDQSSVMLEKAARRAQLQQLQIDWIQGDVAAIPLMSDAYDVVFAESVTIFAADPVKAYREYHRVLRKGGQVWDRELYRTRDHPALEQEMRALYGNAFLPGAEEWLRMLQAAGCRHGRLWEPAAEETGEAAGGGHAEAASADANASAETTPFAWNNGWDPYRFIDLEALQNPAVAAFFGENEAFLQRYREHLAYGVFIAEK